MALTQPQATDATLAFGRAAAAIRELRRCQRPGELLAAAATAIREEGGFSRGVILGVADRTFSAADSDALPDPASDRLRRAVLAEPIPFTRRSHEDALLAAAAGEPPRGDGGPSVLAGRLELRHYVLEPIVLQDHPVAMLVLDRDIPEVSVAERALVAGYAAVVGILLDGVLLRGRTADVVAELRRITAFSEALAQEAVGGHPILPSVRVSSGLGAWRSAPEPPAGPRLERVLSAQELRVARLLADGRSNREIAGELVLSVDTIKSHVARILQKLQVANRSQAAVLIASSETG